MASGDIMAKWLKCTNGFYICSNCGIIRKGNKDKVCHHCNAVMKQKIRR